MEKANLQLIDFYTEWCGPCKFVAKILDEVESEIKDVTFKKINVEEHKSFQEKYHITNVPTLILFANEKEIARKEGFVFKEALIEWINNHR
ncbi:MAG: thioredoxin domain-containing protein [Bacilli bacterium]|jgi:thioredoxin 1|nr:thioredoxin domain-containing protein [Bacilli bacterium]